MKLTIRVDTSRGERRLSAMVNSLSDLDAPLRRLGKRLRDKSKERSAAGGPGWAPLSSSTVEKLSRTPKGPLTKSGRVRMTAKIKAGVSRDYAEAVRVALRQATVKTGGGELERTVRRVFAGRRVKELLKVVQALNKAKDAAEQGKQSKPKSALEGHEILGRIPRSLKTQLAQHRIEVYSPIPWAGVHNDGGPAGHGATEPERAFLYLEDDDIASLMDDIKNGAVDAFERAG